MYKRCRAHDLKKAFLCELFEREKSFMIKSAMQRLKNKKLKNMAVTLANIDHDKMLMMVNEYFKISKTTYMIRAEFAYSWELPKLTPQIM